MKNLMRIAAVTVMVVVFVLSPTTHGVTELGAPISFSDLLQQESTLEVGDKLFSDFFYSATGGMPAADAINVIPIQDDDSNFGIRFQGGFVVLPGAGAADAMITYKGTVTDPSMLISDAHLAGNLAIFGSATFAGVTETLLPEEPNTVLTIFDLGVENQLVDWVFFDEPHQ